MRVGDEWFGGNHCFSLEVEFVALSQVVDSDVLESEVLTLVFDGVSDVHDGDCVLAIDLTLAVFVEE